MISDYVDPAKYRPDELAREKLFIDTLEKEISDAGSSFDYCEISTLRDLQNALSRYDRKSIVVFNWCECLEETEGTAHLVAKYLEENGYVFTGSGSKTLKITDDKRKVKEILVKNGLPTPRYFIANSVRDLNNTLDFPLIVKHNHRHGSAGISNDNIVYDTEALVKVSKRLFKDFGSSVIVESFIEGSEYTVTVWGNGDYVECIDINKEDFKDVNISKIFTENTKFDYSSAESRNTVSSAVSDEGAIRRLTETAIRAYKILDFKDYGIFEYRQGKNDFYIIDCNPNQYLGMDAILFEAAKKFKMNHGETILQICEFAVKRYTR